MTDDLTDLLTRVAAGQISPEDAQRMLAERAGDVGAPAPDSAPAPAQNQVRRISVRGSAVRLVLIGDPSVDTAIAEGPHRVEHVGDVLTVASDLSSGAYEAEVPKSAFASWLSQVNRAGSTLRVRINPDLPVEVLNVAGSLEMTGMRAGASIGVEAGSARVHDGAGPLALSVASGSADVEWMFQGDSSVSTDLGSARVTVMPGSDVSITAEATLGLSTIRLSDGTVIKASPEGNPPVIVGTGASRLGVTSRLGSLVVTVS